MMRAMMILKGRAQCCKDIDDGGYGSCFHTLSLYSASSVSLTLTLSTVDNFNFNYSLKCTNGEIVG